jgi:hypothetical protein
MTPGLDEHRRELLRVFKNAPADLDANRQGRLGPGQRRRLRRSSASSVLIMAGVVAVFIVLILFVGSRPIAPWRWGLIAVVAVGGLGVGVQRARELRRALRDVGVEVLTGPVQTRMQGRPWVPPRSAPGRRPCARPRCPMPAAPCGRCASAAPS